MLATFQREGAWIEPALLDEHSLGRLEGSLQALLQQAAKRLRQERNQDIDLDGLPREAWLHQGAIRLYEADPHYFKLFVDGGMNMAALYQTVTEPRLLAVTKQLIGVTSDEALNLTKTTLRIDLPERFQDNKKKIHLPYHQEASYFNVNVSQDTGLVVWIPLFDCDADDGSLRVLNRSHQDGLVDYETHYEDPVKQRWLRVRLQQETLQQFSKQL